MSQPANWKTRYLVWVFGPFLLGDCFNDFLKSLRLFSLLPDLDHAAGLALRQLRLCRNPLTTYSRS